jgi:hypothetical protein
MTNKTFVNKAGKSYNLSPLPRWIAIKAKQLTEAEVGEVPTVPQYTFEIKSPDGGSEFHTEDISIELINSEFASTDEKRLWFIYLKKVEKYKTTLERHLSDLGLLHGIKDGIPDEIRNELTVAGILDGMSEIEIYRYWITAEVAPTNEEQNELARAMAKLSGVDLGDVNDVAETF